MKFVLVSNTCVNPNIGVTVLNITAICIMYSGPNFRKHLLGRLALRGNIIYMHIITTCICLCRKKSRQHFMDQIGDETGQGMLCMNPYQCKIIYHCLYAGV